MILHSDVRSIVDHYEFAMRDCPTPCPDGPWIVLKRLFAALNELLAAAPKEPEPAEPAQDDEVSDELQWAIDGFGEAAYDWANSNTEPESQLGERERQKERELKAVIAREKADLRAKLEAAEARITEMREGRHAMTAADRNTKRRK